MTRDREQSAQNMLGGVGYRKEETVSMCHLSRKKKVARLSFSMFYMLGNEVEVSGLTEIIFPCLGISGHLLKLLQASPMGSHI